MFVSIKGGSYATFRRTIESGSLVRIRGAAAELPAVNLQDALAILPLIAEQEPEKYDRAACRFLARLILERALDLEQVGVALAALDRLPDAPASADVLAALARR